MNYPRTLWLAAFGGVLSMGAVPVLVKSVGTDIITLGIARLLLAALPLSVWILWQQRQRLSTLQRHHWFGLLAIGTTFALHWISYFYAIRQSTPAVAALGIATYGIHLLWLGALLRGQATRPADWLAVLGCLAGVVLVAPDLDLSNPITEGLLVALGSGLLYALLPTLHQRLPDLPLSLRAWGQFTFALPLFLLCLPWASLSLNPGDGWKLLLLGLLCTLVAHTLWTHASTELPARYSSVIYYLYVPIAALLSACFLDERFSVEMFTGAALIIGANLSLWIRR